jgi:hypothetical protein
MMRSRSWEISAWKGGQQAFTNSKSRVTGWRRGDRDSRAGDEAHLEAERLSLAGHVEKLADTATDPSASSSSIRRRSYSR